MNAYRWVDAVSKLTSNDAKTFKAIFNSGLWKIKFRPSFEETVSLTKLNELDNSLSGIYRYIDSESKSIVYIGKGVIRQRADERQRKDWVFDTIQYSEVQDDATQFDWEHYWINQFKRENKGRLPIYNRQSGNVGSRSQNAY